MLSPGFTTDDLDDNHVSDRHILKYKALLIPTVYESAAKQRQSI